MTESPGDMPPPGQPDASEDLRPRRDPENPGSAQAVPEDGRAAPQVGPDAETGSAQAVPEDRPADARAGSAPRTVSEGGPAESEGRPAQAASDVRAGAPQVVPEGGSAAVRAVPEVWEYGLPIGVPLRLSPKVLLTDPIRMLPSLLLPLAGVLFLGGFSPGSFVWAAVAVVGSVAFAAVRWVTFTYRIVDDRLELSRSLISRSVRTIPLERIRGVDVSTPPLHRLLGIAVLRIDTGASGDEKQEGELNGVTVAEADRLKAVLLWHARARMARRAQARGTVPGTGSDLPAAIDASGTLPATSGAPRETPAHAAVGHEVGDTTPERVFFVLPRKWLVYGPLSGAYLLTPFALLAGAVGLAFQWGSEFRIDGRVVVDAGEWLWGHPLLLAGALIVLVLAMPVVGMIMYGVFNWDFTLRGRDGYLIAERGLITRRSVSLERRRVRGFELVEGLVERRMRLARAWAIVTGLGDSATRGQLLPVVPRDTVLGVVGEAIGAAPSGLRPHPAAARRRRLFRAVFPWLVVVACASAAALMWSTYWWWLAAPAAILALLGIPLGLDRYRSLGHTYDGTRLSVRSGSLRRSQAVVEERAVVGWTLSQTWFQRRAGVLTVTAGVGAGSGGYAALDVGEVEGVAFAAEVTPDWFASFVTPEAAQASGGSRGLGNP
ncbi:putative membrane protein [Streptosporangium subroseum]|uniref:Putative membrane protein n=1 Tax=Streptosporangium subroseum TaxID=106412 RepID=A0A239C6B8_9ACTN|nr:PH domain-containing protein [Streptosporangium subroseum]SNS15777.1 putative membrane protein [Streptosporangium subroseum]